MKNKDVTFFFWIFLLFMVVSCEEKQTEQKSTGTLTIGNQVYLLDKALIQTWGIHRFDAPYEGHHIILAVYSPEVEFIVGNDEEVDSISGTGHGAQFELFAAEPQNIINQEFVLSGAHTLHTFSFGGIYVDFSFDTDFFLDGVFMESGTLTLSVNADKLTLFGSFVLPDGKTGTLEYEGEYTFLEPTL